MTQDTSVVSPNRGQTYDLLHTSQASTPPPCYRSLLEATYGCTLHEHATHIAINYPHYPKSHPLYMKSCSYRKLRPVSLRFAYYFWALYYMYIVWEPVSGNYYKTKVVEGGAVSLWVGVAHLLLIEDLRDNSFLTVKIFESMFLKQEYTHQFLEILKWSIEAPKNWISGGLKKRAKWQL